MEELHLQDGLMHAMQPKTNFLFKQWIAHFAISFQKWENIVEELTSSYPQQSQLPHQIDIVQQA